MSAGRKKKAGRPKKKIAKTVYLQAELVEDFTAWRERNGGINFSNAIRQLIVKELKEEEERLHRLGRDALDT